MGRTPIPGTFGFYLAKLTPDADLVLWQTSYTAQSGIDPRGELAVGADGSLVVSGAVFGADFDLNAAVVKFDAAGTLVWDRSWGGRNGDETGSVTIAADGTVYLVGSTASFGVAPDDAFAGEDTGGVVADANGSLTFAGGFDAALLTILP